MISVASIQLCSCCVVFRRMSRRALKSLRSESTARTTGTRSGKVRDVATEMSEQSVDDLEKELVEARRSIEAKDEEVRDLRSQLEEAESKAEGAQQEAQEKELACRTLEQQLETERLQAEVKLLRALESLRDEHQKAIQREKDAMDEERKRMAEWIRDVKDGWEQDKRRWETTLAEKEAHGEKAVGGVSERTTHASTERRGSLTTVPEEEEHPASDDSTASSGSSSDSSSRPTTPPDKHDGAVTTADKTSGTTDVVDTMTSFLKAQTEAMAAQARAAAAQHLPALASYTGEGKQAVDDGFERWLERFNERSKVAGWTSEQQLYQLKVHLDQTASDVFRMLPESERNTFDKAVAALRGRFKPKDIEELRGIEFHHLMQGSESIEQLGITVQRLGRRAFPSMTEKEFDRLLKGRFFQALLVKWQRKLEAPKPGETFLELYSRALMLEQYEKQYAASAAAHSDQGGRRGDRERPTRAQPPSSQPSAEVASRSGRPARDVTCYHCKQKGHLRRNCPRRIEAPGRSQVSSTSVVAAQSTNGAQSADQLLLQERALLDGSMTHTVRSSNGDAGAVGPTLFVDVMVEGLPTKAMIDTGSQSTIISRALLREVGEHLRSRRQPAPVLEKPTVRLFGKDGPGGGRELTITAQVQLSITMDGESVSVLAFVQPDSEQPCLLGMNALPSLGLGVVRRNGEFVGPTPTRPTVTAPSVSRVSLVKTVTIPGQKGRCLEAHVESDKPLTEDILFEPKHDLLGSLGLSTHESLLRAQDGNKVLVPMMNFQGVPVCLEAGVTIGVVQSLPSSEPYDRDSVDVTAGVSLSFESRNASVQSLPRTADRFDQLLSGLSLPTDKLSSTELADLKSVLSDFSDVFALNDSELGCTSLVQHNIQTGDHNPIKQPPYRTPFVRRAQISSMVDQMQEQGIVQPSVSPWASPVVLVPKKDGTYRFCVDFRRLNAITTKDVYPLPRVDDILDTLAECKYFSSLDLASGYWQVELDAESRPKSAFTTYRGLFEFIRMPFGLCNAPATFQRLMQSVLSGLEWNTCFVYLDDILVASRSFADHLQHLRDVFARLRSAGLRLKPRKCRGMKSPFWVT